MVLLEKQHFAASDFNIWTFKSCRVMLYEPMDVILQFCSVHCCCQVDLASSSSSIVWAVIWTTRHIPQSVSLTRNSKTIFLRSCFWPVYIDRDWVMGTFIRPPELRLYRFFNFMRFCELRGPFVNCIAFFKSSDFYQITFVQHITTFSWLLNFSHNWGI